MPTVTANAAAAVISYESGWGVGNGSERVTSEEWAVASLNFSGTSFYLYGYVFHSNRVLEVRLELFA